MLNIRNFLSITNTVQKIKEAILRFPVVIIDAIIGTGIGLYLISNSDENLWGKLLIITILGFFLFLAVNIFSERKGINKIFSHIFALVILIGYYFYLPQKMEDFKEIDAIRLFLAILVFILGIMLAPYLKRGEVNGFWQYNKKLFFRLVFTGISTGTLFIGVALSLASLNYLFNLDINEQWYARLWVIIVGIISTTVFVSGIPREYENLDGENDYPKVIKIFTQFVLVPLIGLYAGILYLYGGKIILTGEWPKGLVSYLVLIFSLVGIIATLLLHPEEKISTWVKKFCKIFWVIIIPLIALLFGAIWVRITDYGLTHERLFVVILGFWILGLAGYFILGKRNDIKTIFVTLAVIILLFVFGPIINVFSISASNQIKRMETILSRNEILVNGKIQKVDKTAVPKKDVQQISSIVDYLKETNKIDQLQKWFSDDLREASSDRYKSSEKIMNLMGLEYVSLWEMSYELDSNEYPRYYYVEDESNFSVSGFKYLYNFDLLIDQVDEKSIPSDFSMDVPTKYLLELDKQNKIYIKEKSKVNEATGQELVKFDLNQLVEDLVRDYDLSNNNLPREKMTVEIKNGEKTAKIYFTNLTLKQKDGQWKVTNARGLLLYNF